MLGPISLWQCLILLVIVLLIFGTRYGRRYWRDLNDKIETAFDDEIKNVFPAFSAETTEHREAEFIRDQLPKRIPLWVTLITIIAFGALAWWITS